MEKSHIHFDGEKISCSVCDTGPEIIAEGRSEHFKTHVMRDLENPGKYEERLLWSAECLVCRKQTKLADLPHLYYH